MHSNPKHMKSIDDSRDTRRCATCLYLTCEEGTMEKEKCLRFARFVDHLINEKSRDCEYWQPVRDN
jgi:hypothetical protein